MSKTTENIGFGIEWMLLLGIILLNVLDFLEKLSPEWDLIKKIVSWAALGYLLYKANLTEVFFGVRKKWIDFTLIFGYFLLIIKNLVAFSQSVIEETGKAVYVVTMSSGKMTVIEECASGLQCFLKMILDNAALIERYAFYIGLVLILISALYFIVRRVELKGPSVMSALGEFGAMPDKFGKVLIRFLVVLFVIFAFFVIVFNLMMEWLGWAIDSPLLMLGLVVFIILVFWHPKRFKTFEIIEKLGNFGESFYSKFISLFHEKKTIFFGISGMLVLHLLTDVGIFIVPYIFGFHDVLYFKQLGLAGHLPLIDLLKEDLLNVTAFYDFIGVVVIYFLNAVALLLLLVVPGYFWYKSWKKEKIILSEVMIALFFSGSCALILAPVFRIMKLASKNLVGVDIQTHTIANFLSIKIILLICFFVFVILLLISMIHFVRNILTYVVVVAGLGFFAYYICLYSMSVVSYHISSVVSLLKEHELIFAAVFFVFLAITILFYVSGFFALLHEVYVDFKAK